MATNAEAVALIRHLQKLLAYQQLSMEIYNDALTVASGGLMTSGGVVERVQALTTDPDLARSHVLPALDEKLRIIEQMRDEHVRLPGPLRAYDHELFTLFVALLDAIVLRAEAQRASMTIFVESDTEPIPGTDAEDDAEDAALTAAISRLNALIGRQGLADSPETFVALNHEVFNEVRAWRGLPSQNYAAFAPTYVALLSGDYEMRLFSDDDAAPTDTPTASYGSGAGHMASSIKFSQYFVFGLLQEMAWPRRKGVFRRKQIVPGLIVDLAVAEMVEASAAIAAADRGAGLRLFASCFVVDKDWTAADVDELFVEMDQDCVEAVRNGPYETFVEERYATLGDEIPWETVTSDATGRFNWGCLSAAYWGISDPDAVRADVARRLTQQAEVRPRAEAAGVIFEEDGVESVDDYLRVSLETLARFETSVGPVPEAPWALVERFGRHEASR